MFVPFSRCIFDIYLLFVSVFDYKELLQSVLAFLYFILRNVKREGFHYVEQ